MKYLVAYLLSGDAKVFHEKLAQELSAHFHTLPLHERIPPHMTIKVPFETDDAGIAEVERVLRALAHGERAAPLRISGFGHFGFKTIYMDVAKSSEAVALARKAVAVLNENIPTLPRNSKEGNKLHASVARFLTPRQHRHIWRYLKENTYPQFETFLDNFAILKKDSRAWSVHALIPIPRERGDAFAGYTIGKSATMKV